jgi:Ca-activated chloride channel family protein
MRFLRPDLIRWWLLIPVLVASWAIHWHATRAFRRRTPIAARFAALSRRSTWRRDAGVLSAAIVTAAALVFALMRPQVILARRVADYERQDLIVMLDRSVSMRARDVTPSRFSRATLELRNFLRQKPEGIDRIGLVGFADSAVVLSYLTGDVESVLFYLDWLDEDPRESSVMFGTNLGAALKSARDVASKDDRASRKRFLIVSDGEDYGTELREALETFRAEGLRVDCVGIGSDAAVPIPLPSEGEDTFLRDDAGRRVTTTFEEATLRRVAATTGGRFIRSTSGTELARALADVATGQRKQIGWRTSTEYRDLYGVGLAVAAVAGAALWLLL